MAVDVPDNIRIYPTRLVTTTTRPDPPSLDWSEWFQMLDARPHDLRSTLEACVTADKISKLNPTQYEPTHYHGSDRVQC